MGIIFLPNDGEVLFVSHLFASIDEVAFLFWLFRRPFFTQHRVKIFDPAVTSHHESEWSYLLKMGFLFSICKQARW